MNNWKDWLWDLTYTFLIPGIIAYIIYRWKKWEIMKWLTWAMMVLFIASILLFWLINSMG